MRRCPTRPPHPAAPHASRYDGTVRNAMGEVIQFLYGEDGMEGTAIEGQRVEFLRWGRRKFEEAYRYHLDNPGVSWRGAGNEGPAPCSCRSRAPQPARLPPRQSTHSAARPRRPPSSTLIPPVDARLVVPGGPGAPAARPGRAAADAGRVRGEGGRRRAAGEVAVIGQPAPVCAPPGVKCRALGTRLAAVGHPAPWAVHHAPAHPPPALWHRSNWRRTSACCSTR